MILYIAMRLLYSAPLAITTGLLLWLLFTVINRARTRRTLKTVPWALVVSLWGGVSIMLCVGIGLWSPLYFLPRAVRVQAAFERLPVYPQAAVLASDVERGRIQSSGLYLEPEQPYISRVYEAPGTVAEVYAFYHRTLQTLGWRVREDPGRDVLWAETPDGSLVFVHPFAGDLSRNRIVGPQRIPLPYTDEPVPMKSPAALQEEPAAGRVRFLVIVTDPFKSTQIQSTAVAPDGTVWAGSESGVLRLDGQSGETLETYIAPGVVRVYALDVGPDDTVWVGTWGYGLLRFDGEDWITYHLGGTVGDDFIETVTADPDGTVWASTHGGKRFHFDSDPIDH